MKFDALIAWINIITPMINSMKGYPNIGSISLANNHHLNTTMSYGVWKKHKKSKGWSSIEIDSPWNGHTVRDLADAAEYSERAKTQFSFLKSAVHKHLPYDCWHPADAVREYWDENLDQFKWRIQQAKTYPHRKIESYYIGGGEHQTWIAFDDVHALIDGLKANGAGSDLIQKEIKRLFEEFLKTQPTEDQSVTN